MTSRMDRHNDSTQSLSRYNKNEKLYQELYTNKVYTEFSNVSGNIVDLTDLENTKTFNRRELYHKNKLLNNEDDTIKKTAFDYINKSSEDNVNKNYNINDILDEARKNRKIEDEEEKQRRIKSIEYSILSDLSHEKIKEYKEYKDNKNNKNNKKQLTKEEEENLEELIHTITSNSLRKKIDDELLGDLLPDEGSNTAVLDKMVEDVEDFVDNNTNEEPISKKIEDTNNNPKIDDSFYTRSMDLSKEDFDLSEDEEEDFLFLEDSKTSVGTKIFIVLFVLIVIAIIGYIIYKFI